MPNSGKKVRDSLRLALSSDLCGRFCACSGGSGSTFPAFGELQVAHQVIGHVHEADLRLGTGQPDGADEFAAHAVLLEAEDVLEAGADLGAPAVVGFLLGAERLPGLAFLADVARSRPRPAPPRSPRCGRALSAQTPASELSGSTRASKTWLSCTFAGVTAKVRVSLYAASTSIWFLYPKEPLPCFFVQRASTFFCSRLASLQSCGTSLSLMRRFYSRLLRWIGTGTMDASTICHCLA